MPQFLTTSGTSHFIEKIIIEADKELVLITPYSKLSRTILERLTEASQRGVRIKFVYGKQELSATERKRLSSLMNIELLFLENLHAKCYYNQESLIISSMNLYEFSEKNNREMGVLLTRHEDAQSFADALTEAQSIMAAARRSSTTTGAAQQNLIPETIAPLSTPASHPLNHTVKLQHVHQLLATTFAHTRFTIQDQTIVAKSFPRPGVNFTYDGSIRLDFTSTKVYESLKATKRVEFDQLLGAYRCYWNRDVIQIYSAKSYSHQDERTTAEYHIEAVQKAAEALKLRLF